MCYLCLSESETRYIDLYVIGSEGLQVCHSCEMKLVEFCTNLRGEQMDIKKRFPEKFEEIKRRNQNEESL